LSMKVILFESMYVLHLITDPTVYPSPVPAHKYFLLAPVLLNVVIRTTS
jgi:hypothetical protein